MSKTGFVAYGEVGFWAYDVGLGIFLKSLIDRAILRTTEVRSRPNYLRSSEAEQVSWLSVCIDDWRRSAILAGDLGLYFDYPMTDNQMQIVLRLIDEACCELGARESIPKAEMESWDVLDGNGIFSRGYAEFPTAPVVELGRAIQELLQGTLLPAPKGKLWFYGTPTGRQTIVMRFEDPIRPEGISVNISSALAVEQSFLVASETDMKTGHVRHILKFRTNAPLQPDGTGQVMLSPAQTEAIFALVQKTSLGLYPPDSETAALVGDRTTVTIKQGRYRLELEYLSDAPKEWKQVEKLVRMLKEMADRAPGS